MDIHKRWIFGPWELSGKKDQLQLKPMNGANEHRSFAMLTGYPPFQSKTQEEIYKKVRNLVYVWPKASECGNEIPDEAKSLVESCLNLEEDQRPEPDDIVEHRFFDMYDGCIPGRLEPSCCHTKPLWLRNLEPRGDYMMRGYSLEYDERLLGYIDHVDDPIQRYRVCKAAFYALSGVGRKPDGTARRASGRNCNKTAYAECVVEEERGLNPVIPLPDNFVYKYPHDPDGDWSLPESVLPSRRDDSSLDSSSVLSGSRTASVRGNASQSRTQAALLAAQQRRKESQSHAATLRQQASSGRGGGRKLPAIFDPPAPSEQPIPEAKAVEPEAEPKSTAPAGGLAERPVRPRRGVAASYSGSVRGRDMDAAPQMTKSSSIPGMLTVGKTRSQSKRLEATTDQGMSRPTSFAQERVPSGATEAIQRRRQAPPSRPMSTMEEREPLRESKPRSTQAPVRDEQPENERRQKSEERPGLSRSGSTNSSSTNKPRSSLGANPLFHSRDPYEVVPRTGVSEVNTDLRLMFSHLSGESPTRRRAGPRREPHPYVIKWVDYTNRYGIGYVLDDGSVGCVFKAESGQPASSVVLRAGEKHIRRKARSHETKTYDYSEMDQFVPRNGQPVEFYENCDNDPAVPRSAVRRAFISPSVFEVKRCQGAGIKLRHDLHGERAPADYEKIKRVKLVDQFGKYMIGSLGRHGHEGLADEGLANRNDGQFIKFYQRLGNVGVWGFGDGAFQVCLSLLTCIWNLANIWQFNFPDHTKLVIAPGTTRSSSPWIDFYHLSPSAARYLATRGKMHPSGFDTRAVASDEAATFMSIALGKLTSSVDAQIGEVLAANSFLKKIQFLRDVFAGWISKGRLGGRPSPSRAPFSEDGSAPLEMFWEGSQEQPQGGNGGKFVWVTVGAPGGDGDYRSLSLQKEKRTEKEGDEVVETLRKRLQCLGEST